jgi:hypothetical protein
MVKILLKHKTNNMKKIHIILIGIIFSFTICNAQYITLYTPNGSTIETFLNAEGTPEWITTTTNQYAFAFPNAQILAPASRTYNCHSYAWNLSEGGTQYVWMNQYKSNGTPNIWKYWIDASYIQTPTEADAEKIFYYDGDHSAVKSKIFAGKYESKWGAAPLMRHNPTDVPYDYPTHRKYYKKALQPTISGPNQVCPG